VSVVFFSCNSKNEEAKTAIGRVGENFLFKEDIGDIVPKGSSSKDSLLILNRYVEDWIHDQLLIQKAEDNLSEEQKNVEKQLQEYRNSLITYEYEKELIRQHLDTLVTIEEIEKYYEAHKDDFQLKDNILKVIYVKVNKKAPKIELLIKLIKSENIKDREQLATYCHQFAENYFLNDDNWLFFDDLLKEVPIETYNKELFLQNNRFVEVSDSLSIYFLNIKGFKIRENISPLAFEVDNIKNMILNKRKMDLITKMREDIYNEAFNKNKAEIFLNESIKK
jgi:hypothetical protein